LSISFCLFTIRPLSYKKEKLKTRKKRMMKAIGIKYNGNSALSATKKKRTVRPKENGKANFKFFRINSWGVILLCAILISLLRFGYNERILRTSLVVVIPIFRRYG